MSAGGSALGDIGHVVGGSAGQNRDGDDRAAVAAVRGAGSDTDVIVWGLGLGVWIEMQVVQQPVKDRGEEDGGCGEEDEAGRVAPGADGHAVYH